MTIRSYRPGDEQAQAAIYNEAAADLPKFKPASVEDVRRRCRAKDFDPATRLYAEVNGQIVGYVTFQPNGRIGFPWCKKGHEEQAENAGGDDNPQRRLVVAARGVKALTQLVLDVIAQVESGIE